MFLKTYFLFEYIFFQKICVLEAIKVKINFFLKSIPKKFYTN